MNARMLRSQTVGLIRFGQIARAMAVRLAGWDIALQAYTRRRPNDAPDGVRFAELDTLLCTSDLVCVLATLNNESRGLLNAQGLNLMKRGAVLIDTGRGAIIDDVALCQIAEERPDLRLRLTRLIFRRKQAADTPGAILTPHMVGHTQEAVDALPGMAVENVTRILEGRLPVFVCNPAVADRWQDRWSAR
jgi:phosphoglycerate dehydrogenase-like enzyme